MASLFEQYRPTRLADVVGQAAAVKQVETVLSRGWGGRAWWITGPSGSGKTTLARIIASMGADEWAIQEWDAANMTVDDVATLRRALQLRGKGLGKGGTAFIVNEAHNLRWQVRVQLNTALEPAKGMSDWITVIFTTTPKGEMTLFGQDDKGDAEALLSRCQKVTMSTDDETRQAFAKRAREIARQEGIDGLPMSVYERAVGTNMRGFLGAIEGGTFKADVIVQLEREYAMVKATKGEHGERHRAELTAAIAAAKGGA